MVRETIKEPKGGQQIKKKKTPVFNVTFDEISIKNCVTYCQNSHEMKGLVDLGDELAEVDKEGNRKPAMKALYGS